MIGRGGRGRRDRIPLALTACWLVPVALSSALVFSTPEGAEQRSYSWSFAIGDP
ncbi:hypothetical protein [Bailinhaonella thermotolerans]|uniref:hypothetical protein n=1 Tax=Bailinhaonella thermotolerans TaxID=1070861 RepID=UPI00192A2575|nr:hypothetical protein [Bailinhaonella thermotolerans]